MATMNPQEIVEPSVFQATPFKISTITATGNINTEIRLPILYEQVPIIDIHSALTGVVFIEYGSTKNEVFSRGVPVKKKKGAAARDTDGGDAELRGATKKAKRFDNQATLIVKTTSSPTYLLNMKVFKNGRVQITGIKNIDDGKRAIEVLIQYVHDIHAVHPEIVQSIGSLLSSNYEIRLINSDFKLNFEIRREYLHALLVESYGNKCTYEPCIYPGVKLQYFWNQAMQNTNTGNCKCGQLCVGKGSGNSIGACKKITAAVFQSGCIIITGASSILQIQDCYEYICRVMEKHMTDIRKKKFALPLVAVAASESASTGGKKKILIKKSNIVGVSSSK
jgi:TATA-box binding protein (TBP) (component of TFIID and TFIIIB)